MLVKKRSTTKKTGETIAHEVGHIMTLGAGHTIGGGVTAGPGGHAPPGTGTTGDGNLMAPSTRRKGTTLTPSERWQQYPSLSTFGDGVPTPGGGYPITIEGLEPGSEFDLYLDEEVVLSGELDADGRWEGDFVFPANLSTNVLHFLTAQDLTGAFAYSMTCPEWDDVSSEDASEFTEGNGSLGESVGRKILR
ncbi:MAG: hypothetical protein GY856_41085 [bacterium]|nr:hypothetical protein [bacterium]